METFILGGVEAWNKLYKRELFGSIMYPEGRVFEDIATTHRLVHEAKKRIIIDDHLYHQFYRKNSISHTKTILSIQDDFRGSIERHNDLLAFGYTETVFNSTSIYAKAIAYVSAMPATDDDLYKYAVETINTIYGIPKSLPLKHRVVMCLWGLNPELVNSIAKVRSNLMSRKG